ncbi:cbb3-type cytochrome c oxidase subunit I, partial [Staphylococcus epidermidis]|uniref:cbb3-type cytochrome c oxidase subunit I n=1 Tax=Staphylococcus epidermidis TaxID=1282 RepID=UPI0037DA4B6C
MPILSPNFFSLSRHPQLYILIFPPFPIYSQIIPTFPPKPLFAHQTIISPTPPIPFLTFLLSLHHFFTIPNPPLINSFFSISTILIRLPTALKLFNSFLTLYKP